MTDPIFFLRATQLTLFDLVALTGARARAGDLSLFVHGGAPFEDAEPGEVTWIADARRLRQFQRTSATACFVRPDLAGDMSQDVIALETNEPEAAFALAMAQMYPSALQDGSLFAATGVSPGATVHPDARLESGVIVDPGAVIGPRAEIGSGTVVGPQSVIGPNVRIGRDCTIGAQAAIANALIGNRVRVRPGVKIGQAGQGRVAGAPQIGRVILQDDVEIGANTTVDRGSARDTVVGEGTIIGDLVAIGADVALGRKCRIAAQAFVAASTQIADGVRIDAQAGVGEGFRLGADARVLAQAGVDADIPAAARYAGSPARPLRRWLRALATIERLARGGRDGA